MRVLIDSFERWYAGQSRYIKIKTNEEGIENGVHCETQEQVFRSLYLRR